MEDTISEKIKVIDEIKGLPIWVGNCTRCGQDHYGLYFKKLTTVNNTNEPYTRWATCPNNGDPILI